MVAWCAYSSNSHSVEVCGYGTRWVLILSRDYDIDHSKAERLCHKYKKNYRVPGSLISCLRYRTERIAVDNDCESHIKRDNLLGRAIGGAAPFHITIYRQSPTFLSITKGLL